MNDGVTDQLHYVIMGGLAVAGVVLYIVVKMISE